MSENAVENPMTHRQVRCIYLTCYHFMLPFMFLFVFVLFFVLLFYFVLVFGFFFLSIILYFSETTIIWLPDLTAEAIILNHVLIRLISCLLVCFKFQQGKPIDGMIVVSDMTGMENQGFWKPSMDLGKQVCKETQSCPSTPSYPTNVRRYSNLNSDPDCR